MTQSEISKEKIGQKYYSITEIEMGPCLLEKVENKRIYVKFLESAEDRIYSIQNHPLISEAEYQKNNLSPAESPDDATQVLQEWSRDPLLGVRASRCLELPHQSAIYSKLEKEPSIRALLADEVGLGKSIEAGQIFLHLKEQKKINNSIFLVPKALQFQWIYEYMRKFNTQLTWVDKDAHSEEWASQNKSPFESNPHILCSQSWIETNERIQKEVLEHQFDLLLIDEIHRYSKEEETWITQLARKAKHCLFLSASPFAYNIEGFQRIAHYLKKEDCKHYAFRNQREEIGNFPQRKIQKSLHRNHTEKLDSIVKLSLASSEKFLIICKDQSALRKIQNYYAKHSQEKIAFFHEDMKLIERDRHAAWFLEENGASILIATELAGEGRNFQQVQNLIFWDIPPEARKIEQRIGRLDRIGQEKEIQIYIPLVEGEADLFYFDFFEKHFQLFSKCNLNFTVSRINLENEAIQKLLLEKNTEAAEALALKSFSEEKPFQKSLFKEYFEEIQFEKIPKSELENKIKQSFLSFLDSFQLSYEKLEEESSYLIDRESLSFSSDLSYLSNLTNLKITFSKKVAIAREDYLFITPSHSLFKNIYDQYMLRKKLQN